MIKKISLIYGLLTFILVALAGGAAWYFRNITPVAVDNTIPPTATDCTDELDTRCWQTYRNEEYGFEFKFPGGWGVKNNHQEISSENKLYLYDGRGDKEARVIVLFIDNNDQLSLKDFHSLDSEFNPFVLNKDKVIYSYQNSREVAMWNYDSDKFFRDGFSLILRKNLIIEVVVFGSDDDYNNKFLIGFLENLT